MGKKNKDAAKPPGLAKGGKSESIAWKVYSSAAAIVAGVVARKAVEKVWVKAVGKAPPQEPESPAVHWVEAVGWSVASGTTVALARLLATRKAAGAWERVSNDDDKRGVAAAAQADRAKSELARANA